MLVLNRRPGEAIVISGGVRVVILSSGPKGVRLGIDAPAATSILREELVKEVASENIKAGATEQAEAWAKLLPLRSAEDSERS